MAKCTSCNLTSTEPLKNLIVGIFRIHQLYLVQKYDITGSINE